VKRLMHREIIPTLVEIGIDKAEAAIFADQVIDRFSNPYLEHQWESISTNFTSKLRARNMATLERRVKAGVGSGADYMALGFAGYLKTKDGADPYPLLADWENDRIPWGDFLSSVKKYLAQLQQRPAMDVLDELNRQNESG